MKLKNDLLLRAARREKTERTPVWMMRQAGRTDPAYRALRERVDQPLEVLFSDPDIAAEVSLLPKRLGVDAIIFFQDILTPLTPMGAPFVFRPGPMLEKPVRTVADAEALRSYDPDTELGFVAKTLRLVRDQLAGELPLLGFAGSPFTLACFLIEGKSPGRDPVHVRSMMRDDAPTLHRLLDRLADMTADYLAFQIESGADAVQLFESLADILTAAEYEEFAHPYHIKVFSRLSRRVPTILFAKECPSVALMAASGADVLSVGSCVDLADAKRRFGDRVAFQGNVDNQLLVTGSAAQIDAAIADCLRAGGGQGHILNLNHGLLQETPFENVQRFVTTAHAGVVAEAQLRG